MSGYKDKKRVLEYKTQRFESAEALLLQIREEGYKPDILFLDIFMSVKTGIEAAEFKKDYFSYYFDIDMQKDWILPAISSVKLDSARAGEE